MLIYKVNVFEELKKNGIGFITARKSKAFSQATLTKFKNGDTNITLANLDKLCNLLKCQPAELIEYVETAEDAEQSKYTFDIVNDRKAKIEALRQEEIDRINEKYNKM